LHKYFFHSVTPFWNNIRFENITIEQNIIIIYGR